MYVTVKLKPYQHQMTWEELMFGTEQFNKYTPGKWSSTRTTFEEFVPDKVWYMVNVEFIKETLSKFNASVKSIKTETMRENYREFYRPKRSGGLRKIDAPEPELMSAMYAFEAILVGIIKPENCEYYHTNAFAYIKNRCHLDAVKKHQKNESNWFAKFDLHNFFGTVTKEFLVKMLEQIFPFNVIMADGNCRKEFLEALDICFLDGVLPQGSPLSPLLTNILMIPIDYTLTKELRDFHSQKFIYTRYADDFIISSKYDFDINKIQNKIKEVFAQFEAPLVLNCEKTRYGSRAGQNWNLGLMLNKDNEITVGHKNKKTLQNMLFNYAMDKKNGIVWEKHDVQTMEGIRSYYRSVEPDAIDGIVKHLSDKTGVDILASIKNDIKTLIA